MLNKRGLDKNIPIHKKLREDYSGIIDRVNSEGNDYWLGIRADYTILYYKCGKILGMSKTGSLSFDKKYFNKAFIKKTGIDPDIFENNKSIENWYRIETHLRDAVSDYQATKHEKCAQQEFILVNNRNKDSEWFIVDMEYCIPNFSYGRFDMIAISRQKICGKHRIRLIELKSGTKAFNGTKIEDGKIKYGSGIVGHINNFYQFLYSDSGRKNVRNLAEEICLIINNYHEIGVNVNIDKLNVDDIDYEPENVECVILCANIKNEKSAIKSIKNYIYDYQQGSSEYNIERLSKKFSIDLLDGFKKLEVKLGISDKERNLAKIKFDKIEK